MEWGYAILGLGLFGLIAFIYYIDYKKSLVQKDRQPNPYIQGFVFAVSFLTILALIQGFTGTETMKYWWVSPLIWMVTIFYYLIIIRTRLPMTPRQQYKKCLQEMDYFFHAHPDIKKTNYIPFDLYTTTDEKNRENVGNWIFTWETNVGMIKFFFTIDKIKREILKILTKVRPTDEEKLLEKSFPKGSELYEQVMGIENVEKKESKEV